ncbi:MAG: sugar phosphate isomerase/epimerase [Chloroflexi bacterium]|nr:sugar phosphate isomerase/epimerase [Chloroflexota bacterium]
MPKLSISEVTTYNWSFEEDVVNYAAAGIDGIGVFRDKLANYGAKKGVELLANSPLGVANLVGSGYFLSNPVSTVAQIKYGIQDTLEAIELAARIRADCILVLTGVNNTFWQTPETARDLVVTAMKEVAPVAKEAGVRLALEPIHPKFPGWSILETVPDTLEMIDRIGHESVGLMYDVIHVGESGNRLAEIEAAGDRIFCVHINDVDEIVTPGNDRTIMGRGILPLKELLSAIKATGYDGYYDVEIISAEVWAMDYNELLNECKSSFAELMS